MKKNKLTWQQKKQIKKLKAYRNRLASISKYLVDIFDSSTEDDFVKKGAAYLSSCALNEAVNELSQDFLVVSDRFCFLLAIAIDRCSEQPGLRDPFYLITEIFNELCSISYQPNLFDWDKFSPSY